MSVGFGFTDWLLLAVSLAVTSNWSLENSVVTGSFKTVATYALIRQSDRISTCVQCAAVFCGSASIHLSLQRCEAASMHALCAPISHVLAL